VFFYLTGVDYRSAPIEIREEILRQRREIEDFWQREHRRNSAILITCNRLEIYEAADSADEGLSHLRAFSTRFPIVSRYAYTIYSKRGIFRHALRLACGLQSQIKGEGQILIQLSNWIGRRSFPDSLKPLWNKALLLARQIRSDSGLESTKTDIGNLILDDIDRRINSAGRLKIVIIGTGKIAELFARSVRADRELCFVANKNFQKASMLAQYSGGRAAQFKDLSTLVPGADAIISATSSPHQVISESDFQGGLGRSVDPLLIYDLAIPRDVDPDLCNIDGISLWNLDDLDKVFARYNQSIKKQTMTASKLAEDEFLAIYEGAYVK